MSITSQTKIKGKIIAETEKAVRIKFNSGQENWIPKSTIKSDFESKKDNIQEFLIDTWVLEKNSILTEDQPIITKIIKELQKIHSDNLIAVYGIGSFFDESLPEAWIKNDIDVIIIVKTIDKIPKTVWDKRFYSKKIDQYEVFYGYNTVEMYQDKGNFHKLSGVNYEWALIEIKNPHNSKKLFGKDIRDQLPEITTLTFDYDDLLARGLYHLEKSFKGEDEFAVREISKAVFKIAFYLCVYFVDSFRSTSLIKIEKKLADIIEIITPLKGFQKYFQESKSFRTTGKYSIDYPPFREELISYIYRLLKQGILHRKIEGEELMIYLTKYFGGFPFLKRRLKVKD